MAGNREIGGVVLAFGGFVFLIGAVKGTWRNAWDALTGNTATSSTTTGSATKTTSGTTAGGGSNGNKSTNLPGSAPAPFPRA